MPSPPGDNLPPPVPGADCFCLRMPGGPGKREGPPLAENRAFEAGRRGVRAAAFLLCPAEDAGMTAGWWGTGETLRCAQNDSQSGGKRKKDVILSRGNAVREGEKSPARRAGPGTRLGAEGPRGTTSNSWCNWAERLLDSRFRGNDG